MTKQQIKQSFLNYFDRKLNSIIKSEEMNCYYVSGTDSRELLGAINYAWHTDIITDKENETLRKIVYEHLTEAERKLHHSL